MYKTSAIVLKRSNFREFDRRVTLYTRKKGKVTALCRSGLKMQSKLSPHLEPFALVDVMIAPGKNMNHIAAVQMTEGFSAVRSQLEYSELAITLARLVDVFVHDEVRDEEVYALLLGTLQGMEEQLLSQPVTKIAEIETTVHSFVWRLLAHLGHNPELDVCVLYRHPLRFAAVFQPEQGGLACGQCSAPGRSQLAESDVRQLRQLLLIPAYPASNALLTPAVQKTIWTYFQWQASDYQSRLQFFGLIRKSYSKEKNMV